MVGCVGNVSFIDFSHVPLLCTKNRDFLELFSGVGEVSNALWGVTCSDP